MDGRPTLGRNLRLLVALLSTLALFATACGGGSSDDDGASPAADETETTAESNDEGDEPEPAAEPDDEPADEPADEPDDEPAPDDEPDPEPAAGAVDPATADIEAEEVIEVDDLDCSDVGASARGVTADEITVGISLLDFEFLTSINLSPFGWGDQELVWQAIIDDVNANGGIACRQINPIFTFYSPLGTADAEAKCLELTDDNESFVVLFGFVGPAEPANTCIVGQQNTAMIGGRINNERLAQATAPWIQLTAAPERKIEVLSNLLGDEGMIEGRNIALVSATQSEVNHQPLLDAFGAQGANFVVDFITESPVGDTAAEDAEWAVLTEVISSSGADTVLLNGLIASAVRNLDVAGVDVDFWNLDDDNLNNLGASIAPEQADGIVTVTEMTDAESWQTEGIQECRQIVADADPSIAEELRGPTERTGDEENWASSVMTACNHLRLLTQLFDSVGADLTYDNLAATIAGYGEFSLPGSPFNSLGADKLDASDTFRLGIFDSTLGDSGEIAPASELMDVTP